MTIRRILRLLLLACAYGSLGYIVGGLAVLSFWIASDWMQSVWKDLPGTLYGLGWTVLFVTLGLFICAFFLWVFSGGDDKPTRAFRRGRRLGTPHDARSRIARYGEGAKRRASGSEDRTNQRRPQ